MAEVVLFDFFGTLVRYEPDRAALEYPRSQALASAWGWRGARGAFADEWDAASCWMEEESVDTFEESTMVDYAGAFARRVGIDLGSSRLHELAETFTQ